MTTITGTLNIAADPSDIRDEDFVRCKNLRINQKGIAKTRDGSTKLNASAVDTAVWHIEVQDGSRYVFAGTDIYLDEVSIATGLGSLQWSALQYSAFNDSTKQVFALNGADRKRIEGSAVYEWGLDAPTERPTISSGQGAGLTGQYNARYTYVRKVGDLIVAESNPSLPAETAVVLDDQSLAVSVTQPLDPQVTHIRVYRTLADGDEYFLDYEAPAATSFTYGYVHTWEATEETDYDPPTGDGFKFTVTDSDRFSENCYSWEATFEDRDDEDSTSGRDDFNTNDDFVRDRRETGRDFTDTSLPGRR